MAFIGGDIVVLNLYFCSNQVLKINNQAINNQALGF